MFKQLMTYLFGLAVVELGLLEYPVRTFSYAIRSSFDFEYFIYPAICVLFNLYYPANGNFIRQLLHYIYYCTILTIIEVILEHYTGIINYIHWGWYYTWITLFITFYLSRKFYVWFFKLQKKK